MVNTRGGIYTTEPKMMYKQKAYRQKLVDLPEEKVPTSDHETSSGAHVSFTQAPPANVAPSLTAKRKRTSECPGAANIEQESFSNLTHLLLKTILQSKTEYENEISAA
ncbi:unnamed protein product [Citrullus colocynthis]|uniref:Uncharacterized protein n=1 Tax=Citrullus colocynthis TaxID=252529 RepID=A0ABP0XWD8_9ROSI